MGGPKAREPVSDVPILGQVLAWRGKYGWIKPSFPVDHPSKAKGNMCLQISDWQSGSEQPPKAGQIVQLTLDSDQSGLGAEKATYAPHPGMTCPASGFPEGLGCYNLQCCSWWTAPRHCRLHV